ncbi:Uncharacterised protein [Burkholderia pseudomallei]|nr:Uncharacterised protein [Burkholderia pseudomallei]CAJ3999421.1 Uncharacterised protein [Burkholderia pseudomallei]CAJ4787596.1 Uncharacterised protein [Burkholderia pseudomallei]CAJ5885006.1 Uncharacterised protein [Burkholderia pseudomallei]CAJ5901299.1 Uncharacterised protein [Burkholderia pseudomallei]
MDRRDDRLARRAGGARGRRGAGTPGARRRRRAGLARMGRTLLTALMILTVPMALPARMARRFAGALADHAVARRADDLLPERMRVARRKRDRAEAFVFEQPAPGGGREHGAARFAQRRILVQPPAFEQAERQMREQRFLADLVEQQHAARAQARLHVAQRAAYLPRRMQHVGRDHDVVAARRHPLRVERPLDVEQRGAQVPGPRPERGLRVLQERLRHVGEAILADRGRVGPQPLERERRGAARARADLENADRLAPAGIDPRADMADQRVGLHRVEVIRDRIVAVHALDALHRAARKQHVGGGQPAREHVRQRAHAHVGEVDLRAPAAGRGRVEPVTRPVAPDVLARIGLGDHARRAVDDAQPAARREDPQRLVPPARMARARGPRAVEHRAQRREREPREPCVDIRRYVGRAVGRRGLGRRRAVRRVAKRRRLRGLPRRGERRGFARQHLHQMLDLRRRPHADDLAQRIAAHALADEPLEAREPLVVGQRAEMPRAERGILDRRFPEPPVDRADRKRGDGRDRAHDRVARRRRRRVRAEPRRARERERLRRRAVAEKIERLVRERLVEDAAAARLDVQNLVEPVRRHARDRVVRVEHHPAEHRAVDAAVALPDGFDRAPHLRRIGRVGLRVIRRGARRAERAQRMRDARRIGRAAADPRDVRAIALDEPPRQRPADAPRAAEHHVDAALLQPRGARLGGPVEPHERLPVAAAGAQPDERAAIGRREPQHGREHRMRRRRMPRRAQLVERHVDVRHPEAVIALRDRVGNAGDAAARRIRRRAVGAMVIERQHDELDRRVGRLRAHQRLRELQQRALVLAVRVGRARPAARARRIVAGLAAARREEYRAHRAEFAEPRGEPRRVGRGVAPRAALRRRRMPGQIERHAGRAGMAAVHALALDRVDEPPRAAAMHDEYAARLRIGRGARLRGRQFLPDGQVCKRRGGFGFMFMFMFVCVLGVGAGIGLGRSGVRSRARGAPVGFDIDPVAPRCERISRRGDPARHRGGRHAVVKPRPVQIEAARPQLRERLVLARAHPSVDRRAERLVEHQRVRRLSVRLGAARVHAVARLAGVGVAAQLPLEFVAAVGDERDAFGHRVAADLHRVREMRGEPLRRAARGRLREPVGQVARVGAQPLRMPRRERHDHARRRRVRRGGGGRAVLLDHDVRVGAAEAERADGRAARRVAGGVPRAPVGVHVERRIGEIEMAVRVRVVQRRHQLAMREAQQHFVDARDAGRRRRMPDVGLHRAERAEPAPVGVIAERRGQRGQLDRIAELRAGAVRLDVADAGRIDPVPAVDVAQQLGLAAAARRGDAVRAAVLVQARADDHAEDRIAIALGVGEPLQHERAHALARHEAVGRVVEGLAAPLGRQHARRAHRDIRFGRQIDGHAADEREIDLAVAQRLACEVRRDERGRARGVDRNRRPLQVQVIRETRGADRVAAADPGCGAAVAHRELAVLVVHHAQIDAALAARQRRRRAAHLLDRAVSLLQEQPVLRIHLFGFRRRDPEEVGIETVDIVEQADARAINLAGLARLGIVERADGPAARRDLGDRVAAGREVVPERVEIGRARIAARHADDRDPLGHGLGARRPRVGRRRVETARCRAGVGRHVGARARSGSARVRRARGFAFRRAGCGGRDAGIGREPHVGFGTCGACGACAARVDECRDAGDRRVIVDVRRLQRDAIALVDSLDPLDADDRIHADLRERPIDVDLGDVDEQRVGETAHQLAPDPLDVARRAAPAFVGRRLARGRAGGFGPRRRHRLHRRFRRGRRRRAGHGRFAQQPLEQAGEFADARIIVDVGRPDRHAVPAVDVANPFDADDRIEPQLAKRPAGVDFVDPDEQRARETVAQRRLERRFRRGRERRGGPRGL